MRILQVNKFLYRKGGAESYLFNLVDLLAKHGQEVQTWGPREPLNFDRREGLWRDLEKFGHMIWSREAARQFECVVREFKPEVVHIHNIYHHISPSILPVAARYRVPVIMTVHDYHLVNPNYTLYDHGEICERRGLSAIAHRCIKNSVAASLADVVEWQMHKWLRVYERYVGRFLVPTEFVKIKLVEAGMDRKKIEVVSLPVGDSEARLPSERRPSLPYILYAGRITEEKGVYVLLEIAKQLSEIQFKIAGTGPEESGVRCQVSGVRNVELLGFVEKTQLQELIAGARLVLVPSLWYDPSPLAVLEAMAAGKVVVASKIGGISELIEHDKTGFLVKPGVVDDGVVRLQKVWHDQTLLKQVGKAAVEEVRRKHDPEKHYEKLMEIYRASGH